ncbi:fimbrial protein [Citrobacter amalonaticus]|uniref:fimbrial protein n=1 Tax=Citrobacter amalonaticus TaxID=35703 RepID=UPI00300DA62C
MKNVTNRVNLASAVALMALCVIPSGKLLAFDASSVVQVQVTGTIIASSCQVEVPQEVSLGQISRQDLSVPGGNSSTMVVALKLSQCSPQLTRATVSFTGMPYTDDPAYANAIYANEMADGAKDIGLQLFNIDGKALVNLANGVSYSFPVQTETHAGLLSIGARMYSPHGTPTAGDFKSAVTVNFTYQ